MTVLVSPAPARSLQQRRDALDRANRIRSARAQMKRDLKTRRLDPLDVLDKVPWHAETMKVDAFLEALPKFGPTKTAAVLRRTQISRSRTLLGLSKRQRRLLGGELMDRLA